MRPVLCGVTEDLLLIEGSWYEAVLDLGVVSHLLQPFGIDPMDNEDGTDEEQEPDQ